MKVSRNWIQQYLATPLPADDELLTRIGAQLGGIEEDILTGPRYAGAVVVRVVECAPLEGSDHLNLCFVDDGGVVADVERRDDGLVQVVCGAPNVTADATVVWLPPGATVPSTYDTEPFVLEARKLRGAVSNGMLASAKELAVGDSHEGLLLLEGEHAPGVSFAEAYGLDDLIIDIENKMFTHRPDCFGQLGVAREVAGILGRQFVSPSWYDPSVTVPSGEGLALQVTNELPELVPRFTAIALKNVTVGPSPVWLQTRLSQVGLRPINNIVDITNYLMVLTAQPIHAYDYDKVAAMTDGTAHITVRGGRADERAELLNGKTVAVRSEDMLITAGDTVIGLGGLMGGSSSETSDDTKNIIIEVATFDMYAVRRASMHHGIFTDAASRFNKGQSPLQNGLVLAEAVRLVIELAGGQVASDVVDVVNFQQSSEPVEVAHELINSRLGLALPATDMKTLLTNVEFSVEIVDDVLHVTPPFWRTDIAIAEDVIEEVGRLHGYDRLPLELPLRGLAPAMLDPMLDLKHRVRTSLAQAGANELLTYSFVPGELLDRVGQPRDRAFRVVNALSPELQYYRFSALANLLEKVHPNIKAGHDTFALFELGKGHDTSWENDDLGVPTEGESLDIVLADKSMSGAAYYQAKQYLETLAATLHTALSYQPLLETASDPLLAPFQPGRSAMVTTADGSVTLGVVGEFLPTVRRSLKLPTYCAGATLDLQRLLRIAEHATRQYRPLSRYPKVSQDISLKVAHDISWGTVRLGLAHSLDAAMPADCSYELRTLDIYQREDDREHKQLTFRIELVSNERTLTDDVLSGILESVAAEAAEAFGAQRL